MRPFTEDLPKNLIEVNGHPFAHYQLSWLSQVGVTEVIFSIGYQGDLIRAYVESGKRWGLKVDYVDEGKILVGTGGAVRLAFEAGLLEERFLLTYGDSFLPMNFNEVWQAFLRRTEPALMTVLKNQNRWDKSNAEFDRTSGRVFYEKNSPRAAELSYIDYGLSAFERQVIRDFIPAGQKADLATLFHELSVRGMLSGHEVTERFYEVGSPTGLADFTAYLNSR
jgi:N-acetyl-alpha-D-muramate 1-phosphate uridylyltransferase